MAKQTDKEQIIELKMLDKHIKELQEQIQALQQQQEELNSVDISLEELKTVKKGSEMLIPVAGGIFMKGELVDAQRLLLNVGQGVVVEKTSEEIQKMIRDQAQESVQLEQELTEKADVLISQA